MRSFILSLFLFVNLYAQEVVLRTPEGELEVFEIDQNERFQDVILLANHQFGFGEFLLDFQTKSSSKVKKVEERDYFAPLKTKEREDIKYIINTLGTSSLAQIAKSKSSLKKAGDRIEAVHPLVFLRTIFTDEEMKVSINAMQGRLWVWDEFFTGISETLDEEHKNISPSMLEDFSEKVGLDPNLLLPLFEERKWKEFIKVLIDKVPRNTETDRYNM